MRLGDPSVCQSPIGVMCIISKDIIWVMHISFVRMVKFKFLADLPVDHQIVSSFILFLC